MWSILYIYKMNGRKVVIWLETDVGRELPPAWFDVIRPGLAELSSLYVLTTDFSPQQSIFKIQRLLKAFN